MWNTFGNFNAYYLNTCYYCKKFHQNFIKIDWRCFWEWEADFTSLCLFFPWFFFPIFLIVVILELAIWLLWKKRQIGLLFMVEVNRWLWFYKEHLFLKYKSQKIMHLFCGECLHLKTEESQNRSGKLAPEPATRCEHGWFFLSLISSSEPVPQSPQFPDLSKRYLFPL